MINLLSLNLSLFFVWHLAHTRLIYLNVFALLIFILGWTGVLLCRSKALPLCVQAVRGFFAVGHIAIKKNISFS